MRYHDCPGPFAIAHRGGAGLAPENTVEAFRRSHALGVRYLETDVRLTRDGRLVAFHDALLNRVTAMSGRVRSRVLSDLTATPVRGGGFVGSMDSLLAAFPDSCFTIDVKEPGTIEPLANLLTASGAAGRVCVAGARESWLERLRALVGPDLTTALSWRSLAGLASPSAGDRFGMRRLVGGSGRGGFAHVPLRLGRIPVFSDDLVARAHDLGIRVIVWTVNEPALMHRLLDRGVDGIITDRPDLLRDVLIGRGQWHTPDSYGAVTDLVG